MSIKRTMATILTIFALVGTLSGCEVFEKNETYQGNTVQSVSLGEVSDGCFVQTGEVYQQTYNSGLTFSTIAYDPDDTRVIWWLNEDDMIPTLYKDSELIYVSSKSPLPTSFTLEQFEDLGYSIGVRNIDVAGQFKSVNAEKDNVKRSSSFDEVVSGLSDNKINITSLNDIDVSDSLISRSGTILGLEKDKKYTLGYYVGTYYYETEVVADTHILASYKTYPVTKMELTKDDHVIITLPDNLQEGYYLIDNIGIFYYIDENAPEDEKVLSK